MKKFFLLSILLVSVFAAAAQDTVRYLDPWYSFADRGRQRGVAENYSFTSGSVATYSCDDTFSFIYYSLYEVSKPSSTFLLYGIAVTGAAENTFDVDYARLRVFHNVTFRDDVGSFLSLGDWSTSHIDTLETWNMGFMKDCMFEYEYFDSDSVDHLEHSHFVRCHELYFDQPLLIHNEGALYIGFQECGLYLTFGVDSTRSQCWQHMTDLETTWGSIGQIICCKNPNSILVVGAHMNDYWGGIFPIVGLRCTAPRGMHIIEEDKNRLIWDGDTNAEVFQVSVCDRLTDPELGSLATTTDTSHSLSFLNPDSAYMIYLRKMCSFGPDTIWSDWSGPIVIGDTTGWANSINGIDEVDAAGITLTPNPTSGKVAVVCSTGIQQVTVFNAAGVQVQGMACGGETSTTIDTKGWPAGQYVVTVETAVGTVSKVLTVAR